MAEGYLNTLKNAPTRLSALPYRQPLLLRLLKVPTSCDVERLFSLLNRINSHDCHTLGMDQLEKLLGLPKMPFAGQSMLSVKWYNGTNGNGWCM